MKPRYLYMPLTAEQEKLVREGLASGRITVASYKDLKWRLYSIREMFAYWHLRAWLALQPLRRRWMVTRHRLKMSWARRYKR